MEKFEIEEMQGFDVMHVRKRNIIIEVVPTDKIPENLPKDAHIVFATVSKKANGEPLDNNIKSIVIAFCIINPDAIEYETFLFDSLVQSAIDIYFKSMLTFVYDRLDYAPAYKARYIDSRPNDPALLPPDLLAYICWKESNKASELDFYEWKELKIKSALN